MSSYVFWVSGWHGRWASNQKRFKEGFIHISQGGASALLQMKSNFRVVLRLLFSFPFFPLDLLCYFHLVGFYRKLYLTQFIWDDQIISFGTGQNRALLLWLPRVLWFSDGVERTEIAREWTSVNAHGNLRQFFFSNSRFRVGAGVPVSHRIIGPYL